MAAGLLKLVAVQNLRGLTCDSLFFVVPRRHPLDDTWEGDILREFVLYSVMMRATQRLVILTEYMVTMPLPEKGRVRNAALQLGVKECRSNGTIASNVLQRRLAWVRLCNAGRALWGTLLEVDAQDRKVMEAQDLHPCIYFSSPRIFQELAAESPAGAALQKNFLRTRRAQELLRSCWALASTAVKEMCSELGASWTMLGGAGRSCWAMLGRRGAGLGFQRRPEGVPFTIAFRSENARQHLHSGACATEPEEAREGPAYEEIYGMRAATTVRRSQPGAERALPWEQGATRGGGQRGGTRGGSQTRGRLGAPDHHEPSARSTREDTRGEGTPGGGRRRKRSQGPGQSKSPGGPYGRGNLLLALPRISLDDEEQHPGAHARTRDADKPLHGLLFD